MGSSGLYIFAALPTWIVVVFPEGPALKRKPTPPKTGRRASEEEKADTESEEQELVTVTKVVEEVRSCSPCYTMKSHKRHVSCWKSKTSCPVLHKMAVLSHRNH